MIFIPKEDGIQFSLYSLKSQQQMIQDTLYCKDPTLIQRK